MRTARLIIPIALAFVLTTTPGCGVRNARTDSVRIASDLNADRFAGQPLKIDAAEFLVNAADASRMEIEASRAALAESETTDIREFAQRMVTEHQQLLERVQAIASTENVSLPPTLSNKRAKALAKLEKKHGRWFDRKYVNMMLVDHEHDVVAFKKAAQSSNPAVQPFAKANLGTIEAHLARIREIKRKH